MDVLNAMRRAVKEMVTALEMWVHTVLPSLFEVGVRSHPRVDTNFGE